MRLRGLFVLTCWWWLLRSIDVEDYQTNREQAKKKDVVATGKLFFFPFPLSLFPFSFFISFFFFFF